MPITHIPDPYFSPSYKYLLGRTCMRSGRGEIRMRCVVVKPPWIISIVLYSLLARRVSSNHAWPQVYALFLCDDSLLPFYYSWAARGIYPAGGLHLPQQSMPALHLRVRVRIRIRVRVKDICIDKQIDSWLSSRFTTESSKNIMNNQAAIYPTDPTRDSV